MPHNPCTILISSEDDKIEISNAKKVKKKSTHKHKKKVAGSAKKVASKTVHIKVVDEEEPEESEEAELGT